MDIKFPFYRLIVNGIPRASPLDNVKYLDGLCWGCRHENEETYNEEKNTFECENFRCDGCYCDVWVEDMSREDRRWKELSKQGELFGYREILNMENVIAFSDDNHKDSRLVFTKYSDEPEWMVAYIVEGNHENAALWTPCGDLEWECKVLRFLNENRVGEQYE